VSDRERLIGLYGVNLTGYPHYRNMMFALVIALQAKTVVETGLAKGESTRIFLNALKHTKGHLYTYDIVDSPDVREELKITGFDAYWTFRLKDSVEGGMEWKNGPIDILYLDSDHREFHVLGELNAWTPHLKPNGIVLIHDTNHPKPHPASCQTLEAAGKWVKEKTEWNLVNLNDPLGMALLWRTSN